MSEVMYCDYCHEDNSGYFRMMPRKDKPSSSHVFLYRQLNGEMALTGTFSGKGIGDYDIKYCPMCGRKLTK